jgi:hypothetical protein
MLIKAERIPAGKIKGRDSDLCGCRLNLLERWNHNDCSYSSPLGFEPFALANSLMFGLLSLFKAGNRPLKSFLNVLFHCLTQACVLLARRIGGLLSPLQSFYVLESM